MASAGPRFFGFVIGGTLPAAPGLPMTDGLAIDRDDNLYFGPYGSAGSVREMLRVIKTVFPLRTCTNSLRSRTSTRSGAAGVAAGSGVVPILAESDAS